MIFNLDNGYEAERFKAKAEELLRRGCAVELRRIHQQRTMAQNRYLHLLLGYFASEFGMSLDEVKVDIFKRKLNADIFTATRKNKRGERITYLRSSANLDKGEMSRAIDRFRNWSAGEAGLYLPDANEHSALLYAMIQVEKDKEYLYETDNETM